MLISVVLSLLIGFALYWYVPDCRRCYLPNVPEKVSIIIPARNEEKNIERLLQSIRRQKKGYIEIIVANDHSTDRTAAIARKLGAKVINLPSLPDGWLGKAWGCWKGAQKATGEILLFLDADTVLERDGVQRLVSCYYEKEKTLLSVHPYHETKQLYESFSCLFNAVVMGAMNAFHLFQDYTKPSGAFGQCLLCRKEDYFQYGGHLAQKGAVLETMSFGRHVLEKGGSIACISGRGAITMRMYPEGFSSLIAGWSKSFAKGAAATNVWCMVWIALWLHGLVTLSFSLLQPSFMLAILYALVSLQLYVIFQRIGSYSIVSAVCFPIYVLFFLSLFCISCVQTFLLRRVSWKGRTIQVRKGEQ